MCREVTLLTELISRGELVCLTGTILQETLQGFHGVDGLQRLERALTPFPIVSLDRRDYTLAATIWTTCRAHGVQAGTVEAQIAAATINHRCRLLTADADFRRIARHFPLALA